MATRKLFASNPRKLTVQRHRIDLNRGWLGTPGMFQCAFDLRSIAAKTIATEILSSGQGTIAVLTISRALFENPG